MLLLVDEALRGPRGARAGGDAARTASASPSSTSSRTPIRCSGRSSGRSSSRRRPPAALPGRRSEAVDLRLPRRRRQHLRGARAARGGAGRRAASRAQLPLDPGGHRHVQRDLRSAGAARRSSRPGPATATRSPTAARRARPVDRSRPLTLLRVRPTTRQQLPMRVVRVRAGARHRRRDRAASGPGRDVATAREIFVLTRTRKESQTVADALAARGVPACWPCRRASTRPTRRGRSGTCCARSPIPAIRRSGCAPG